MSGPIIVPKGISLQRAKAFKGDTVSKAYDKKLKDVAKLYETQFLREMFKAMKGTVKKSGFIKEGMAEKIYQEKLENNYIDKWGDKGGVGLGNIIYQQLKERVLRAKNGFVPQPQGPIPIEKGTVIKVDETQNAPSPYYPIDNSPPSGSPQGGEMSFIMQAPTKPGEPGTEIKAPWDGQVKQVLNGDGGRKVVRIQHEGVLESVLSFKGNSVDLEEGQRLQAGEKIGLILDQPQIMTWKVTSFDSA